MPRRCDWRKRGPKRAFSGNQAKMARHGPRSFDSATFHAAGRRKTRFLGFPGNPETGLGDVSRTKRGLRQSYGNRRFLEMREEAKSPASDQAGIVPGVGQKTIARNWCWLLLCQQVPLRSDRLPLKRAYPFEHQVRLRRKSCCSEQRYKPHSGSA